MPPPARKYDPGDRAAKREEMRRLAEMKRQREAAAASPRAAPAEPEPVPRRDDPFEGPRAKAEEARRLRERRQRELAEAAKDPRGLSRWKEQAEAQMLTVEEKIRAMFGEPGSGPKERDRRRRR